MKKHLTDTKNIWVTEKWQNTELKQKHWVTGQWQNTGETQDILATGKRQNTGQVQTLMIYYIFQLIRGTDFGDLGTIWYVDTFLLK